MNNQTARVLETMRQRTRAIVGTNREKIAIGQTDQPKPPQPVIVSPPMKAPMTGHHKRCQKDRRDRRRNLQEMMLV